jgi:hypothetical protein
MCDQEKSASIELQLKMSMECVLKEGHPGRLQVVALSIREREGSTRKTRKTL